MQVRIPVEGVDVIVISRDDDAQMPDAGDDTEMPDASYVEVDPFPGMRVLSQDEVDFLVTCPWGDFAVSRSNVVLLT